MRRAWFSTLPMAAAANIQYRMLPQNAPFLGLIIWAIVGLAVLSAIVFSCADTKEKRNVRRKRPSAWTGGAYDMGHHGGGHGGDGSSGGGGYMDGGGGSA